MQKKSVALIFGVAAIAAIIFWARLGTVNQQQGSSAPVSPQRTASVALPVVPTAQNLPPRTDPAEYNEMMSQLSENLSTWRELHPDDQRLAVTAIIQLLDQQGAGKISNPPAYYAERINQASVESPEVLEMSLDRVVIIFAVMDYDFETGQDKEELAMEVLGPSMYAANKARRQQAGIAES